MSMTRWAMPRGDEIAQAGPNALRAQFDPDARFGTSWAATKFQVMLPDIDDRGVLGALAARIIAMLRQALQP